MPRHFRPALLNTSHVVLLTRQKKPTRIWNMICEATREVCRQAMSSVRPDVIVKGRISAYIEVVVKKISPGKLLTLYFT
jgi:hypothetical protein